MNGIYKWSRNPQNLGCFLIAFGASFITRSIFSFILSIFFVILIHLYIVFIEEKYLEKIFKEKYIKYKQSTHRYFGPPKKA
ncbi:MAG: methyltransferase family protein [Candidatus Helarchaeota archaeon]